MANIRVDVEYTIKNGSEVSFTAPCNCSDITGLKVYHPGGSKEFTFKDAHGNALTGLGNLFSKGAYVKAILDVTGGSAYMQNADTNAYLEAALAGKAPAGYGLGGTAKMLTYADHIDNVTANGWYAFSDVLQGFPDFGGCVMHVVNMTENWLIQEITNLVYYPNTKIIRQRLNGVWQPNEWVNPPMIPGEEYRTTERYNGKPVYRYCVNLGAAPESGCTAITNIPVYSVAMVIEARANTADVVTGLTGGSMPIVVGNLTTYQIKGHIQAYPSGSASRLLVILEANGKSENVYGMFKYTKTTD